ncbi:MAG: hypothetical protein HY293_05120 [Planctomycetes bacterium]|nr:hypothetical protein [Planctomycetota bacterium]
MSNSDWDLGQKLVEQGACSLDQVREILSHQERMRQRGAVSKPFARTLLERGYARRDQLIRAGVPEKDLPPPVEEKPAAAPAASTRAAKPLLIAALLLLGVGGLIVAGRGIVTGEKKNPDLERPREEDLAAARQAELDGIVEASKSSSTFENAPEIVRKYESFKSRAAGTQWEVEAHRKLKEYRDRAEVHAGAELAELQPGEGPLMDQKRWGELLAHWRKFPAKFLETTDSGQLVKRKIQEVSQKLLEAYAKGKAEVEKFADAKKFSDALAAARSLEISAPAERRDEVQGLRARIERESRGAAERTRVEVADAYFKVDGPFKQAMLRRDGYRAALAVREFVTAPWKPEQKPFVTVRGVDYEALLAAFEPWDPEKIAAICEAAIPEVDSPGRLGSGEEALLDLRNAALMAAFIRDQTAQFHAATSTKQPLNLPGLGEGCFDKKEGRTVFVTKNGDILDPEAHPLTDPDLVALAMMVGPETAAMHARVGVFYFYSAPDRVKEAYEHLAKAYTRGARGVKLFLGGLAVAAEGELRRELETKFGAAQDLFKSRNWKQAKKLLGDLLLYADHPTTVSLRPEIERMLFEMSEGTEKEKRLAVQYLGKVEAMDASTLRVTYDFEGNEQQEAFESVAEEGARKFKGRWRVDRGGMESWKTPLRGDVSLEYDLTPVEEAQNIVLDLYYHRGAANHYAVVLGFDWVGKQDGDRDNSAEDRFGMPRTCVIKYPVVVDKSRWTLGDPWEVWKSRLAGKPVQAWRPEKGRTSRMRVERTGSSLRLLADRTLVWEGQDDEYSEGQLLFYSDRRCRIDNLVITFKP